MGTNYYARYNLCPHCGRYDLLHVGKSSAGWKFHFQAYPIDETGRWRLTSFQEWLDFLAQPTVVIQDEFKNVVSLSDFMTLVRDKQQTAEPPTTYRELGYLDAEGYGFYQSDFT